MEKTSVQLVVFRGRYIVSFNYGRVREKERDKEKREREEGTIQIKIFYHKQGRGLNRVPGLRRSYLGVCIHEQLLDHGDQHGEEEGGRNSSRKHTFYSLTHILYQ